MGSRKTYWLTAAAIALLLWLPAQAEAQPSQEKILYSGSGIHAVSPDGSNREGIVSGRAELPALSPDGRSVAYQRERGGNTDVYVANADGSGERRLTKTAGPDTSPAWSPDGQRLAFQSGRGGRYGIYTMNVDGGGVRRITGGRYDASPAWSPDGRRIAFERAGVIYTVGSGGGKPQRLTYGMSPAWSPDGEGIAFSDGYDAQVFTIGADGSGRKQLTGGRLLTSINPVWSPDGERIAYSRGRYGERLFEVYVMNADGSGKRRVAKDARFSLFASDWGMMAKTARSRPPGVRINGGPPPVSGSRTARFDFVSDREGARFLCSLDGARFKPCISPKRYTKLDDGLHRLRVKAVDGGVRSGVAVRRWRVDTRPPVVRGSSLFLRNGSSSGRVTLRARIVDNGPTVKKAGVKLVVDGERRGYSYNGKSGRLTASFKPSPGRHEIRLVAKDRAGNTTVREWAVRIGR